MTRILRFNDLKERGIVGSRMTLHRIRKSDPSFPAAIEVPGGIGWREDEIEAYLDNRPRRPIGSGIALTDREAARA